MNVILNIDTAIESAYISIAADGKVIAHLSNNEQRDHGSFLQPAIQELLKTAAISIRQIDAVAVSAGPGSYTGLRVGMATAKGICYGINKPLITIPTLEILAAAALLDTSDTDLDPSLLLCPMIDARRMEVYTALYDISLNPVLEPVSMILEESSFANVLLKNKVLFFGNGAAKWSQICKNEHALFITVFSNVLAMSNLAYKKYQYMEFADLAYSEPFYLKEFFSGGAKH